MRPLARDRFEGFFRRRAVKVCHAFVRVKVYVTVDVNHLLKIVSGYSRLLIGRADTVGVTRYDSTVTTQYAGVSEDNRIGQLGPWNGSAGSGATHRVCCGLRPTFPHSAYPKLHTQGCFGESHPAEAIDAASIRLTSSDANITTRIRPVWEAPVGQFLDKETWLDEMEYSCWFTCVRLRPMYSKLWLRAARPHVRGR